MAVLERSYCVDTSRLTGFDPFSLDGVHLNMRGRQYLGRLVAEQLELALDSI